VVVFDKTGKYVRSWGKLGQGPGEFSQPHSIVIDSKDRVYVADRNNARIQIFDSRGKFLTEWKNIITPWALAVTKADEIYVCGSSPMLWSEVPASQAILATPPKDQLFMKLDTEGRLKQLWTIPGEVSWLHSIAVAPDGSIYFGEVQAKRVQRFMPVGAR
jgi:DNA-binding beta-propeller fold protein YncE